MKSKSEYEEHIPYKKIFKNRERRLRLIELLRFFPSSLYLKMVFRIKSGKKLNLKNPKTFCDKLNWLKLHNIHEEYTDMADKIRVRSIVNGKMGGGYVFPAFRAMGKI